MSEIYRLGTYSGPPWYITPWYLILSVICCGTFDIPRQGDVPQHITVPCGISRSQVAYHCVICSEVQKVVEEIEAAIGISLTSSANKLKPLITQLESCPKITKTILHNKNKPTVAESKINTHYITRRDEFISIRKNINRHSYVGKFVLKSLS